MDKEAPVGKYRRLHLREDKTMWNFEVQDAKGNWHTLHYIPDEQDTLSPTEFVQSVADSWCTYDFSRM